MTKQPNKRQFDVVTPLTSYLLDRAIEENLFENMDGDKK